MVIGTGIDIIEVERIRKAAAKPAFLNAVFTEAEREYFARFRFEAQTIAGTFAAKEATAKALSVGFRGIKWTDIEVLHDESGKPYTHLVNGALDRMQELAAKTVHISISHIKELAVAQAIVED
ncbi:MAG: holo-ACP synthase [Clostridia bacterium]|nr:holo-ACP synthase [Clostridia bacterium]